MDSEHMKHINQKNIRQNPFLIILLKYLPKPTKTSALIIKINNIYNIF